MFLKFSKLDEVRRRAFMLVQSGDAITPVFRGDDTDPSKVPTPAQAAWFVVASLFDKTHYAAVSASELASACHRDGSGTPIELEMLLAGLSQYEPDFMAQLLLNACAEVKNDRRGARAPDEVVAWYQAVQHWCDPASPDLPPQLHGATAVAVADGLVDRWLRRDPDWRDEERTRVLKSLGLTSDASTINLISLLAYLDHVVEFGGYAADDNTTAERRHFEELVDKYLEPEAVTAVVQVTSWLLAWRSDTASRFLAVAAADQQLILDAVESMVQLPFTSDRLSRIAQGFVALVRHGEESRLDAGSSWLRDRRHFGRPESMRAPSGTWLGSADLETVIRYRVDTAAERWRWEGGTQEEHFTGALMEQLMEQLTDLRGVSGSGRGVVVRAKLTRKVDEKVTGADLGLLVDVDLANEVRVTKGHLVQIKRSSGGDPSDWTIDVKQLLDILELDETATYWLLSEHPGRRAVCVPAAYLLGLFRAIEPRKRTGRFTVKFKQVASASVPLGDVMCDLLLGLWLGSRAAKTTKAARGDDSNYRPAYQLRIAITGE